MRKLIILFLAVSLFAACNNDKGKVNRDDRRSDRDKDDYRDKDEDAKDKDTKSTDYTDDKEKTSDDRNTDDVGGSWSASDVKVFVDNCADEAERKGMQRSKAEDYCSCMQRKLEAMYPNTADVANLDVESPRVKAMIEKCRE